MQGTTKRWGNQLGMRVLYGLAVLSFLGLAVLGQAPGEVAGWILPWQQRGAGGESRVRSTGRVGCNWQDHVTSMGWYLAESWPPVLLRSLVLWGLWAQSGGWGPAWLRLVPWGLWLWCGVGRGWPALGQQLVWDWVEGVLWQGQRGLLVGYAGLALSDLCVGEPCGWCLAAGCVVSGTRAGASDGTEAQVAVVRQADGSYRVTLRGHFTLAVSGDHPFRMRLLVLFLSLLDVPGATRGSRRTRDGRTPFVRQMQLQSWFGVPHPEISRWLKYWQEGRWADLLSLHSAEVLTTELVAQIVEVFATFPTWSAEQLFSTKNFYCQLHVTSARYCK